MKDLFETKYLIMQPFSEKFLERLYDMHLNPEVLHLWDPGVEYRDFTSFAIKLTSRIAHRWDHYSVFEHKKSGKPLGFAYCYNGNELNGITFMCVYIDSPFMGKVWCVEAAYCYLNFLFASCGYRKVYAEVFAYNQRSLGLVKKAGFIQEGCLVEHQLWQKRYWDQYIYGLDIQRFKDMTQDKQKLIKRLLNG
ncbi:MAG: GNAT family N-acetyltransferase [Desulfobulbaceae bacterium]|nr:GNAT family N-acetyltransferase [Desulfobulbaceae bacterium]